MAEVINSDHLEFVERVWHKVIQAVTCQRSVKVLRHFVPDPVDKRLREVVGAVDHKNLQHTVRTAIIDWLRFNGTFRTSRLYRAFDKRVAV